MLCMTAAYSVARLRGTGMNINGSKRQYEFAEKPVGGKSRECSLTAQSMVEDQWQQVQV